MLIKKIKFLLYYSSRTINLYFIIPFLDKFCDDDVRQNLLVFHIYMLHFLQNITASCWHGCRKIKCVGGKRLPSWLSFLSIRIYSAIGYVEPESSFHLSSLAACEFWNGFRQLNPTLSSLTYIVVHSINYVLYPI